jgi:hypothetical protein
MPDISFGEAAALFLIFGIGVVLDRQLAFIGNRMKDISDGLGQLNSALHDLKTSVSMMRPRSPEIT